MKELKLKDRNWTNGGELVETETKLLTERDSQADFSIEEFKAKERELLSLCQLSVLNSQESAVQKKQ